MNESDKKYLKQLRDAAYNACNAAQGVAGEIKGAINWGDLGCVSAERYETDEDDFGYRVLIEEAAPDAYHLQKFIANYLDEHGFSYVEVMTEW
jgi:hypothetical protein